MKEAARVRLVSSSPSEQQPQANAPPRRPAAAARSWRGPAILSHGFRPFFLSAGVWALIGIAVWFLAFGGAIKVPTAFSIVDWHAHEMIFGYTGAVIAGFLLTAIPNWTGRLPVAGAPLAGLVALWAAGRVAIYVSAAIGRFAAGAIDVAFLVVFTGVVAAEVISGRNSRNAKVVALVAALALANIAFHIEDARTGLAEYSTRGALAFIVMLILLIGGRVTPSFTNNWLAKAGRPRAPRSLRSRRQRGSRRIGPVARRVDCRAGERRDRRAPARRRPGQSLATIALARTRRTTGCARPSAARRLFLRGAGVCCSRSRCSLAWHDALCGWRACLGYRWRRGDDARNDDPRHARP